MLCVTFSIESVLSTQNQRENEMAKQNQERIKVPTIRIYRVFFGTVQIISGSFNVIAVIALLSLPMDNRTNTKLGNFWWEIPLGMFVSSSGILGIYSRRKNSYRLLFAYAVFSAVTLILCVLFGFMMWSQLPTLFHHLKRTDADSYRHALVRFAITCTLLATTAVQAAVAEFGACIPYAYIRFPKYHKIPTQDPSQVVATSGNETEITACSRDRKSSSRHEYSRRIYQDKDGAASDDYEEVEHNRSQDYNKKIQHVYLEDFDRNKTKNFSSSDSSQGNDDEIHHVYAEDLDVHKPKDVKIHHVYAIDSDVDKPKYYSIKENYEIKHIYYEGGAYLQIDD